MGSVHSFVETFRNLLKLEHEAEKRENETLLDRTNENVAASKGIVLLHLKVQDIEGGLLGKTLVTLQNRGATAVLPAHSLSQHDIVRIRPMKDNQESTSVEGVIYKLLEGSVTVAVDDDGTGLDELLGVPVKVEKIANHVTYKRLSWTLDELAKQEHRGSDCGAYEVLFNGREPRYAENAGAEVEFLNKDLDESQREAVIKSLSSKDITLIHGPPGTGKTTTLVEYIRQEVLRGSRVLACAGSNIAVDNIVEGIVKKSKKSRKGINIVRIGHPARMLPQILEVSLDYKVLHSDQSQLARECREEVKQLNRRLLKLTDRKDREERRQVRQDIRYLYKEERKRQKTAVERCLNQAQVVACTLSGAASFQVSQLPHFDVVVIDEAAQSTEPSCWSALLQGKRSVLLGDHLQLPPTIISDIASRKGLSVTLFERLNSLFGAKIGHMLVTQYRMNEKIMTWASEEMYGGQLTAHASVAQQTLTEAPVLLFIDTAGCDMEEQREEDGDSLRNPEEARVVMKYVQELTAASGIPVSSIGIITPYSAQVSLLRSMRNEQDSGWSLGQDLEVSTVDGFQGREKDVVIISMVRSGNEQVGFLADSRRMNVAITRAKRHSVIVGDSETISKDPFLARLVTYFEENGEYQSAESYR
jgi:superfamily I DNA and/or RNA helicase